MQADVVELHDQADRSVDGGGNDDSDRGECGGLHPDAVALQLGERDRHDLGGQDEVGADRAGDLQLFEFGRIVQRVDHLLFVMMVAGDRLDDLLGRFERQIGTADHQQRSDQDRQETPRAASAAGSRISNLFLSDPQAILPMIGSSRSGARPVT